MADTLVSTLYPPEIETFQPAFECTQPANITFSLSAFNSAADIKFIHVSIVDHRNNENVLPSFLSPQVAFTKDNEGNIIGGIVYGISNGILYIQMPSFTGLSHGTQTQGLVTYNADRDKYMVSIPPQLLNYSSIDTSNLDVTTTITTTTTEETASEETDNTENITTQESESEESEIVSNTISQYYWRNNRYYKVQIRFDSNAEVVPEVENQVPEDSEGSEWIAILKHNGIALEPLELTNYMYTYREYFSEWSTVTLIKPIAPMAVVFTKFDTNNDTSVGVQTVPGFFRLAASISFEFDKTIYTELTDEEEHLKEYQIQVYKKLNGTDDLGDLIFDSGSIFAIPNYADNRYGINTIIDLNETKPDDVLIIQVSLITNNNYTRIEKRELTIDDFNSEYFTSNDLYFWNVGLENPNDIFINQEDGCAVINFTYQWSEDGEVSSKLPNGICYIYRSYSKDNFKTRDIIYKYEYYSPNQTTTSKLSFSFEDYTICSLYQYKYCAQYETAGGQWTARHTSNVIYPKFYDMLLMRQNRQIAIRYNGQISSWKPTVNRQKVDTLGGKYPKFVENAMMNYKTFQISGLISAEGDYNRKFMSELVDANVKYYDEEFNTSYLIRNDTAADGENLYPNANDFYRKMHQFVEATLEDGADPSAQGLYEYDEQTQTYSLTSDNTAQEDKKYYIYKYDWFKIDTDYPEINEQHDSYPHDHWYWERTFREELTNWLNDGDPKLYRSMPEGNVAVMLTDINLTPNAQLGRRLYNFSATLYEVGDGYSLESLDQLGIINIPNPSAIFLTETSTNIDIDTSDTSTNVIWTRGFGQYIKRAGVASQDIINSNYWPVNDNKSTDIVDIWDSLSLRRRLSTVNYTGYGSDTMIAGPISGIGLTSTKIQFITTPHYFYYDGTSFYRVTEIVENLTPANIYGEGWNQLTIAEQTQLMRRYANTYYQSLTATLGTLWLGYKVQIDGNDVFVNEKGYYQIPSNIIVRHLIFEEEDEAIVEYEYQYIEGPSEEGGEQIVTKIKTVLGQLSGTFYVDTNLSDIIKRQYEYYNVNSNSTQYVKEWAGIDIDVTPYAIFDVSYDNSTDHERIYVGRTGVLNLFQDTKIDDMIVRGVRMVVVDFARQPYLDPWECVIDEDVYNNIDEIINPKYNTIYVLDDESSKIYYINGHWYDIESDSQSSDIAIAKIPVEGMINYTADLLSRKRA